MRVYVCKNHDTDGDLHLAVFTSQQKAIEFCRENDAFNNGDEWLYYSEVEVTDDVDAEFIKYNETRMV